MSGTDAPGRIWATVNGASTRLPDGSRQLLGGWSEDPERPRAVAYVRADLTQMAGQTGQPPADSPCSTPEQVLAEDILAELVRARSKFPGRNVTFAALVEEVGELAKATFEGPRAAVRKEAIQVAVLAMRMVLDGDHTFDAWRAARGLDALADAPEVAK